MTTRRVFLKTVVSCAAVGVCTSGCGSGTPAPGGGGADIPAGNASALSEGSLRAVDGVDVAIGRDAHGIYAMSLVCTHQGCDMSVDGIVSPSGVECTCHGSRFDANGHVVHGPAHASLPHFEVSKDAAGNLTIHSGTEVDASTRLT